MEPHRPRNGCSPTEPGALGYTRKSPSRPCPRAGVNHEAAAPRHRRFQVPRPVRTGRRDPHGPGRLGMNSSIDAARSSPLVPTHPNPANFVRSDGAASDTNSPPETIGSGSTALRARRPPQSPRTRSPQAWPARRRPFVQVRAVQGTESGSSKCWPTSAWNPVTVFSSGSSRPFQSSLPYWSPSRCRMPQ